MKTLLKTSFVLTAALAFLAIPAFALAASPRSPYGGIGHPTYATLREAQRSRPCQTRSYAPIRLMESRQSSSCELTPSSPVTPDETATIRTEEAN